MPAMIAIAAPGTIRPKTISGGIWKTKRQIALNTIRLIRLSVNSAQNALKSLRENSG